MQNKTMPRNRQNSEALESVNAILVCNFLYFFLALSQKRLGYVDIRKRKASGLQVFTVSEKKEKKKRELILKVICCNSKDYLFLICSCRFLHLYDFSKKTLRI